MDINKCKAHKKHTDEPNTILLQFRITEHARDWMIQKGLGAKPIFMEAIKTLGYKKWQTTTPSANELLQQAALEEQ